MSHTINNDFYVVCKIDGKEVDRVFFKKYDSDDFSNGLKVRVGGNWYKMNGYQDWCRFNRDFGKFFDDEDETGEIEIEEIDDEE